MHVFHLIDFAVATSLKVISYLHKQCMLPSCSDQNLGPKHHISVIIDKLLIPK